jgi:hypothetical protein
MCCVVDDTSAQLPYNPSTPVPQLWDAYLPWTHLVILLLLAAAIALACACACGLSAQLLWLATGRRRPYANRVWDASTPGNVLRANVPLANMTDAVSLAREQLETYFGDHFSKDMYATRRDLT